MYCYCWKICDECHLTWSFDGSPPCSWESLLEEGSISLKDLSPSQSHWSDPQSCNNQCVDLQSSSSCSFWDVVFFSSCWNLNLIGKIHVLKICRMVMNLIYCNLWINDLKSFDVGMICNMTDVVCCSMFCGCVLCGLSKIIVNCSCCGCVYPCVVF